MKMIEVLKEEMNKSLKEIEEKDKKQRKLINPLKKVKRNQTVKGNE